MFAMMNRVRSKINRAWQSRPAVPELPTTPVKRTLRREELAWLEEASAGESFLDETGRLRSCLCTQEMLESPEFMRWIMRIEPTFLDADGNLRLHRKLWEFCYIIQALYERELLQPNLRGLGFAVGKEPLPSFFASFGCSIVASDLDFENANEQGWTKTDQHAAGAAALNERGLCPAKQFNRLVSFRNVDMNHIPVDLRDFDFCWSSCSFEHLGSIKRGEEFIVNMLDTLRPGGVGVHTTEFNLLSNDDTIDNQLTVLFRKQDIDRIAARVRKLGHHVDVVYQPGNQPADLIVDVPPYCEHPHLKLNLMNYTTTSIGLIVTKSNGW